MSVESNEAMERRLVLWNKSAESGLPDVTLYFALIDGFPECVRIDIGAAFKDGESPRRLGARFKWPNRLQPIDATTLRSLKLASRVKEARRTWAKHLSEISKGTFFGVAVSRDAREEASQRLSLAREAARRDRPGPRYQGREHLERVALIYRDARERGESPTKTVQEHFTCAYSTAARWVSIARQEGLLPRTARGEALS